MMSLQRKNAPIGQPCQQPHIKNTSKIPLFDKIKLVECGKIKKGTPQHPLKISSHCTGFKIVFIISLFRFIFCGRIGLTNLETPPR